MILMMRIHKKMSFDEEMSNADFRIHVDGDRVRASDTVQIPQKILALFVAKSTMATQRCANDASHKNLMSSDPFSHHSKKRNTFFLQSIYWTMARFGIALALLVAGGAEAFMSPVTPRFSASSSSLNAVSKSDTYSVTLLPGDGIGPEITEATREVLTALTEKCGFKIELNEALIGGAAIDAVNDPFPQESLDQCLGSDSVLLACIGGFKWDTNPRELRPESGLLKMRKSMGLFANLRPAKVLPQLLDASTLKREVVEGVDIMVVRELTGDVYFGTPKGIDIIDGKQFVLYLFLLCVVAFAIMMCILLSMCIALY